MVVAQLKAFMRDQALNAGRKDLDRFNDGLRAMSDQDVGVIVAVATVIRVNMEIQGYLPEGLFNKNNLPSTDNLGRYQLDINKVARQFTKMRQPTDSVGAVVLSYSLRSLNVPELRELGRDMWSELVRGFPHVEKALKDGETEKGEKFPESVWQEWDKIPLGLEPIGDNE